MTKPMAYDGESSLNEYLNHFDLCVAINNWTPEQAGAFLGVSLNGTARRLLEGIKVDTEAGYLELWRRLRARFEPENATGTYKAQLRAIERRPEQTLSSFASDVLDLVRRAYPTMPIDTQELLAKDKFVDALGDADLRIWVWQTQPPSLNDAVAVAIEGETCLMREKGRRPAARVRALVEPQEQPPVANPQMEELLDMVRQMSTRGGGRGGRGRGGPMRGVCYRCQRSGHFARECTAPAPVPRAGSSVEVPYGAAPVAAPVPKVTPMPQAPQAPVQPTLTNPAASAREGSQEN